jgi:ADP-ribose pyrophosphatase YjhB (NUDIX family)
VVVGGSYALYPLTLGDEPRFCPACGRPVEERVLEADHRPRLVCAQGHITWRNSRVVVGTLPIDGGRVHLARRAIEPALGRWGNPSGFLELGESVQEGARRETEEETELRVEVGRLIAVYSRAAVGIVTIAFEARRARSVPSIPTRSRGAEIAFSTAESALRDWVASLPGRGSAFEPELYVEGDPDG